METKSPVKLETGYKQDFLRPLYPVTRYKNSKKSLLVVALSIKQLVSM